METPQGERVAAVMTTGLLSNAQNPQEIEVLGGEETRESYHELLARARLD